MTQKKLTEHDFFFCFTKKLSLYLKSQGIDYIIKAKSIKDDAIYTIYQKDDELSTALKKYSAINN